jgi:TetR/AcrR family transcriptional regulator, tetracycline repressor protein
MERSAGRPKAGDERLSRERIVAAALRLVDAEGVAALSMRRLASELAVDPMAIYHYLPNKRAVLGGVVELALAELAVPQLAGQGWRVQVLAFAHAYHALIRAHPALMRHLLADLALGGGALLRANEQLYAALASAGLAPPLIVAAANLLIDYLHGVALAGAPAPGGAEAGARGLLALLSEHPADQFPVQREILSGLAVEDQRPAADQELAIILRGIEALAASA